MHTNPKIRVAIVYDYPILRRTLNEIIRKSGDMEVACEAGSSAQAMRLLRETPCDVALLDLSMPDRTGLERVAMICTKFPTVRVLVVSDRSENDYAVPALKAGASGYLAKQSMLTDLVGVIRTVHGGRNHVKPQAHFPPDSTVVYFHQPVVSLSIA